MHDRPTSAELTLAVRDYVQAHWIDGAYDARGKYMARVIASVLELIARDVERFDEGLPDADIQSISEAIRRGEAPMQFLETLQQEVLTKLQVVDPGYTTRVYGEHKRRNKA